MRTSARVGDSTCAGTLTYNYTHTHTCLKTSTPIILSVAASSGQAVRCLMNRNENSENDFVIEPLIICLYFSLIFTCIVFRYLSRMSFLSVTGITF